MNIAKKIQKAANKKIGEYVFKFFYNMEGEDRRDAYEYETAPYCGHHFSGWDGEYTTARYHEGMGGAHTNKYTWLFLAHSHSEEGYSIELFSAPRQEIRKRRLLWKRFFRSLSFDFHRKNKDFVMGASCILTSTKATNEGYLHRWVIYRSTSGRIKSKHIRKWVRLYLI